MRRFLCLLLSACVSYSVHAALPRRSRPDEISARPKAKKMVQQISTKRKSAKQHSSKRPSGKRYASGKKNKRTAGKKPQRQKQQPRKVAIEPSKYGGSCRLGGTDKMSNSMYFLPVQGRKDQGYHNTMQGSLLLKNGRVRTYTGKVVDRAPTCETTDTSATGACLKSYFSVAADLRYHEAGDIICVPEIAEKKIRIRIPETGQEIVHPGCFVVEDKGGLIKGPNRFDFFTGTDYPLDSENPFNKIGMGDKASCSKSFVKIPRGSLQAAQALAMIDKLTGDSPQIEYADVKPTPRPDVGAAESTQ